MAFHPTERWQDIWFAKETVAAELRTGKLTHPCCVEPPTTCNCRTSDLAGTAMAFELMRAPDGKPQVRRNEMLGAGQGGKKSWEYFGALETTGCVLPLQTPCGMLQT